MYNKRTFLVDSENVFCLWKQLLPFKGNKDRVIVFYTDNSPHISYSDMSYLLEYHDSFEMVQATSGTKNALDFQLVSYLGFLLKSAPKTDYIIVSNDMGFNAVCDFWNTIDAEYSVARMTPNEAVRMLQEIRDNVKQDGRKASKQAEKDETENETSESEKAAEAEETAVLEEAQSMEETAKLPEDYIPVIMSGFYAENPEQINIDTDVCGIIRDWNDHENLQELYFGFKNKWGIQDGSKIYRYIKKCLPRIREYL